MNCVCAGITILLSLSVYQMIVSEKLPATSDAVPLLGIQLVNLCRLSIMLKVTSLSEYDMMQWKCTILKSPVVTLSLLII